MRVRVGLYLTASMRWIGWLRSLSRPVHGTLEIVLRSVTGEATRAWHVFRSFVREALAILLYRAPLTLTTCRQ